MGFKGHVKKKTHSFQVFGKRWRVTFHDPASYTTSIDKSSKGMTYVHERLMHIDLEHLSEELLRHELTHVYAKELSLVELGLKGEQVEDFFCELFGKQGVHLIKQARTLYLFARKLKWKKGS